MTVRRFFCPAIPAVGAEVELPAAEALHAVRVLRLAPAARLDLLDGQGTRAEAEVVRAERGRRDCVAVCRVLSRDTLPPPTPRVRLFVAPPRGRLLDLIVRQATELGVARLTPVLCQFSVGRHESAQAARSAEAEAVAAAKQSGNPFLPAIDSPLPFADAVAQAGDVGYFGDAQSGAASQVRCPAAGEVELWVGPEGGFAEAERQRLLARGFVPVRVGRWVLRVETAVPTLLGWLMGRQDDPGRTPSR